MGPRHGRLAPRGAAVPRAVTRPPGRRRGTRRPSPWVLLTAVALASACSGTAAPSQDEAGPPTQTPTRTTDGTTATGGAGPSRPTPADTGAAEAAVDLDAPAPVRVVVPSIGVDADVVPLGLEPDGALETPADFTQTGWYEDGPEPGERGPAVVVGHVDSWTGPAVFFRLRELDRGDPVAVEREDGSTVRFVVDRVQEHPKDEFPTRAVYGGTAGSTLRLVTCGGDFDDDARSYLGNVVVYATRA